MSAQPSASAHNPSGSTTSSSYRPWYRIPAMYLVIFGPASVVVASLVTAVIAYRGADRPLLEHGSVTESSQPHAPAMTARNHAATPRP